MELEIVVRGLGDAYDEAKFVPIWNRTHLGWNKPWGGLWGCVAPHQDVWKTYAENAYVTDQWWRWKAIIEQVFVVNFSGQVFVINNDEDLEEFLSLSQAKFLNAKTPEEVYPDWELLLSTGVDAVLMGEKIARKTKKILGWALPSILVLNKETIIPLIVE